jgi:large subunit ribosomal protein L2
MGKRIRAQRIGVSPRRRSPGHRFKGAIKHASLQSFAEGTSKGEVIDFLHDPGRTAPVARVKFEDGSIESVIAPNSLSVGDEVSKGPSAKTSLGNSVFLSKIPEGTLVYNVEANPGDGGKFARASGTFIKIVSHDPTGTVVQMKSGAFKTLNAKCRANVGVVAGGGRLEKPFVKGGTKRKVMRARGKLHPRVSGVHMNPTDHPFGGGNHPHIGKPKTVSRHAPPGRKVGSISPKRTGKKR